MGANPKVSFDEPSIVTMPTQHQIMIKYRAGRPPDVDKPQIELDRDLGGGNAEIVWTCDTPGKAFNINFKNGRTPFQSATFSNIKNHSGVITGSATGTHGPYKYSVEIEGQVLDPTIIVRP